MESAPPDEAVQAYEQARAHYKAGRYPAAIEDLERALSLDPDSPELVYNVARVYELMGDLGKAVSYYGRYRDMLPEGDTDERERVDETIARLEGAQRYVEPPAQPEPPPAPSPPPPPPPERERPGLTAAMWTTLGLSASALVSGAVSGGVALRREKELGDWILGKDGGPGQRGALARKADRLALASDLLLGVGAVTALTALVLHLSRPSPSKPPPSSARMRLEPAASPYGFGLRVEGAF